MWEEMYVIKNLYNLVCPKYHQQCLAMPVSFKFKSEKERKKRGRRKMNSN